MTRKLGLVPTDGAVEARFTSGLRSVLEPGQLGQSRAGRQLAVADFTELGLGSPVGLFNLGSLVNLGSAGGSLGERSATVYVPGVDGVAASAAQFRGSTTTVLYRDDTGVNDPFRIRTGSWGIWARSGYPGGNQLLIERSGSYYLDIANSTPPYVVSAGITTEAGTTVVSSQTVVADERWHFIVGTYNGTLLCLYVDGVLESRASVGSLLSNAAGVLNIGARGASSASNATSKYMLGRLDEGFVTPDVLSEEQVRLLYALKLPHGAGAAPREITATVMQRRRGGALVSADFPSAPLRLYNLRGLDTTTKADDLGSNSVDLTGSGAGIASLLSVVGPDGLTGGAWRLNGVDEFLFASDTGLPAGTATRSYGIWFKTTASPANGACLLSWGSKSTAADCALILSNGFLISVNGASSMPPTGADPDARFVADGRWHFACVVEDSALGLKRTLYLDGAVIDWTFASLTAVTLMGASGFRIGARYDGTMPYGGDLARAFVTGASLMAEQIQALYAVGSSALGASPKDIADNVERVSDTHVYFIGDDLEPQHQIELNYLG